MKKAYFNHQLLVGSANSAMIGFIAEIADIKEALKPIPLLVSDDFWNLHIQSGTLSSFLKIRTNQDEAFVLILSLMNHGPYFFHTEAIPHLSILPEISQNCFARDLMSVCFKDNQEHVLSLKGEKILTGEQYTLSLENRSQNILNLIGKERLLRHLEKRLSFKSIDDVFQTIEKANPSIVILESAKKNSQKHQFKGAFFDVYKTISTLESEMSSLLEGIPDAQRAETFKQKTGFEISRESSQTLGNSKYRKHREFIIPSKGIVLFEWHIKIGDETRIHYYIDKEDKKIYIGHCGRHLLVQSYNS